MAQAERNAQTNASSGVQNAYPAGDPASSKASIISLMQHPFLLQLKQAVKPLHHAAENSRAMKAMQLKTVSKEGYLAVLARMHGFVAPMEAASASVLQLPGARLAYSPTAPSRLGDIEADLVFFKMAPEDIAALPRLPGLPDMPSAAHALGVCYLLEGSRLGGLLLARSLHRQFGFTPGSGLNYFASGGADVKTLWVRFTRALTRFVDNGGDRLTVINSAMVSFAQLNNWLKGVKP